MASSRAGFRKPAGRAGTRTSNEHCAISSNQLTCQYARKEVDIPHSASPEPAASSLICWRPWPCSACAERSTLVDYIVGCYEANGPIQAGSKNELIDKRIQLETQWLRSWFDVCPHTFEQRLEVPRLDEGSEHEVYLEEQQNSVVKVTKKGIYGDFYAMEQGRVFQWCCSPVEYLIRMEQIENQFGFSATVLGLTEDSRFVSRQRFIVGDLPLQDEIDSFLLEAAFEPVRQDCWLWKRPPEDGVHFWVGDARADNFVKTPAGLIPIDLRAWITVDQDQGSARNPLS